MLLLLLVPPAASRTLPAQVSGVGLASAGTAVPEAGTIDSQSPEVQLIFRLTNEDRAAQGLAPLTWSAQLAAAASAHALRMAEADSNELSHRYPGEPDLATRASAIGAHFSSIAENIAQGGSARAIEKQWMTSVPHRANILDPRMSALGVAVFASGGTLHAVEDFAAAKAALTRDQIEAQVSGAIHALTPQGAVLTARAAEEARAYCARTSSAKPEPDTGARFEIVWEAADLQLPAPLADSIQSGLYHGVAIGACPAQGVANRPFAVLRTAVLLF